MRCPNCGAEIEDGLNVCSNCGIGLETGNGAQVQNQNINNIAGSQAKEPQILEVNYQNNEESRAYSENIRNLQNQQEDKGLSITSLILGIACFVCIAVNTFLALLCSILAIVFGAIGRKKGAKGLGTAGMILGIIGTVVIVIIIILAFAIVFSAADVIMNSSYY